MRSGSEIPCCATRRWGCGRFWALRANYARHSTKVVQAGITLADRGEAVRPYLRSWYEAVRYNPGFDAAGMTSAHDIEKGREEHYSGVN